MNSTSLGANAKLVGPGCDAAVSRRFGRWLLCALLALAGCTGSRPLADDGLSAYPLGAASTQPTPASAQTRAAFAALGPGINVGNMLESPREVDRGSRFRDDYPELVQRAGFGHVRLPVRWSAHAERDAQAHIDPAFLARVSHVIDRLLEQNLTVVLNMHHYRQLDGDKLDAGEMPVDRAAVQPRFLAMWRQIAEHFAGRPERLWFELYNEPHGELEAGWNDLASRAEYTRLVREAAEQRGIAWGYWEFDSGFGAFDPKARQWRGPLREALLGR